MTAQDFAIETLSAVNRPLLTRGPRQIDGRRGSVLGILIRIRDASAAFSNSDSWRQSGQAPIRRLYRWLILD
jgi:hypothetical protein